MILKFYLIILFTLSGGMLNASFKGDITPNQAMIDQSLTIIFDGLNPEEVMQVTAECIDQHGTKWQSSARFKADIHGVIDVSKVAPLDGSYHSIDPMGLIWSMTPQNERAPFFYYEGDFFKVNFKAYRNNQLVFEKEVIRQFKEPDLKSIELSHDMVGTFYYRKGFEKKPGIVILSSSTGEVPRPLAQVLASHGYPVLALAYFQHGNLPKDLELIPLEYVHEAIQFVRAHPSCNGKIGLMGTSRGGELALLFGAYYPKEADIIIANVPSSVAYSSMINTKVAAWTYQGEPIPFIKGFKKQWIAGLTLFKQIPYHAGSHQDPYRITPVFLAHKKWNWIQFKKAAIPVEKISCPLLLLSADQDQMWPSALYCQQVEERLKTKGSTIAYKHLCFKEAGHGIAFPYYPTYNMPYYNASIDKWFDLGGTAEGNAKANQEAWQAILTFIEEHLSSKQERESKQDVER